MPALDALNHCYPASFVSNNHKIFEHLRLLLNETLLGSVRRFRASVLPSSQRTKLDLTKLITEDFGHQVRSPRATVK